MQNVTCEKSEGVATIALRRPDRRNALSPSMRFELGVWLREVSSDEAVKVVLLEAEGSVFCAGGDLTGAPGTAMEWREKVQIAQSQHVMMMGMRKPVIAAVQGAAIGGGASLALASDILLMAEDARLEFPFVKIGLVPDGGAAFLLQKKASAALAMDVLLTGGGLSAEEAMRAGLTRRICPKTELKEEGRSLARSMAALPREALMLTKSLLSRVWASDVHGALDHEADAMGVAVTTDGYKQAMRQWHEKRSRVHAHRQEI